jgi:hypothetical protein
MLFNNREVNRIGQLYEGLIPVVTSHFEQYSLVSLYVLQLIFTSSPLLVVYPRH